MAGDAGLLYEARGREMHGLHELRLDQVVVELGLPRPVEGCKSTWS